MSDNTVTVDVREDIRLGREPFSKIMSAVAGLGPAQQLLLVAPFEPRPLFAVLAKQGFKHSARQVGSSHWEVRFARTTETPIATDTIERSTSPSTARACNATVLNIDVRGLEPPQPMVKILETLAALPEGSELRAHTDRRPIHLYAHLEDRGFTAESEEQNDGSFITHIRSR